MKTVGIVTTLITAFIVYSAPASAEGKKPFTLALFSNVGGFTADGVEADGSQNVGYLQFLYTSGKWGAGATSSFASTDYLTGVSVNRFKRSSQTDTAVTTFYKTQSGDLTARFGVDLGVPTGSASQSIEELGLNIADDINQDLLLINAYGSGFNMAGHMALSYGAGALTWGLGARYLVTGAYDPMTDLENDEFDPGDSLLVVASVYGKLGEQTSVLLNLSRMMQTKDKQDGKDIFRNGDITALELRLMREWSGVLSTTFVASARQQESNERTYSGSQYKVETGNANANMVEGFVEMSYIRSRSLNFTGVAGIKNVEANSYAPDDYLYDGGRTKWFVEPGVRWNYNKTKMVSLKARYATVNDNEDYFSPNGGATYKVYNVDLGVIVGF